MITPWQFIYWITWYNFIHGLKHLKQHNKQYYRYWSFAWTQARVSSMDSSDKQEVWLLTWKGSNFVSLTQFRLWHTWNGSQQLWPNKKLIFSPLPLPSPIPIIGNLSKHDGEGWRERHKTNGLISKTMTLHVRYRFLYISLPSSAKQQREMIKFKVLCKTWTHDGDWFSFFYLNCNAVLTESAPDCSATLDRLNELKLSRRSLKYLGHF